MTMNRVSRHGDAAIAECQQWIAVDDEPADPVARMVARSRLPERTCKGRFAVPGARWPPPAGRGTMSRSLAECGA
jgi:hypothetical protein